MKILYGIQGTGNGHLSRGKFIYDALKKYTKDVDVLISGDNYSLSPAMPIKYINKGVTFVVDNGKIDYFKTISNFDLYTSYIEQKKIPFKSYDLIITDFEPITAWSSVRYSIPSIHISHQASFLDSNVPRPVFKNFIGEYVMKYFCPTNDYIGLHYQSYGPSISEPIILNHIISSNTSEKEHITIYLPWYNDEYFYPIFKNFKNFKFHVFSKKIKSSHLIDNIIYKPINEIDFSNSVASAYGVICNAGFQTTSEVMYLGKRLLTIPVKGQYEQLCNVVALNKLGVSSIDELNEASEQKIKQWLLKDPVKINFKNNLQELLDKKIKHLCQ